MKHHNNAALPLSRLFLVAICLLLALAFPIQVFARSISEIQKEISQKQKQANEAQSQVNQWDKKANTVEGQIEQLQDQIASIQVKIDQNTEKQQELTKKIAEAQDRLEKQKELLSANIRAMYIEGDISPIEMLASSKNLSDFVDKQEYRDRIKENITNTLDEIEQLKKELDEQRKEVTSVLEEQKGLQGVLGEKEGEADAKLDEINMTKAGFNSQVKARMKDVGRLQREMAAAQQALSSVNVDSLPSSGTVAKGQIIGTVGSTGNSTGPHLHLRAQWGSNSGPVNPMQFLGGRWSYPLSAPITQGFGGNYAWYGPAGHDGIDFGASAGTPIKAVEGGTLYKGMSQSLVGYWHFGCMAMVKHSGGLISIYAHMQAGNC